MSFKFRDVLNEKLKDPEFKKEFEVLEPEFSVIRAIVEARKAQGLPQKELSQITGIAQADISKIETGILH